jgi:hypothetical protein
MSDLAPMGIAGHGFLLCPHWPCRVVHLRNGTLLIQPIGRNAPGTLPAVAAVSLGKRGAHAEPREFMSGSMPSWQYGEDGPTISLGNGAKDLGEVFAQIDSVPGESPWNLLGLGFWIDFPQGFTAQSPISPEHPFFQLDQEGEVEDASIMFKPRPAPAHEMRFNGTEEEGTLDGIAGTIRWATHHYEHAGVKWTQRFYALPFSAEDTLVMIAQSPQATIDHMLSSADQMAASFELTTRG